MIHNVFEVFYHLIKSIVKGLSLASEKPIGEGMKWKGFGGTNDGRGGAFSAV
jgi:hypothetical protein